MMALLSFTFYARRPHFGSLKAATSDPPSAARHDTNSTMALVLDCAGIQLGAIGARRLGRARTPRLERKVSDAPETVAEVPASSSRYEFSEEDNRIFRQLALRMRVVGVALITWGILQGPPIFRHGDLGALVLALGLLVTGIWTIRAAHGFRAIDRTQGSDISHLMSALKSVHNLYTLVASVIAVIVVWIVIALVFALVVSLG
jgi:uncharacterized membrane protein